MTREEVKSLLDKLNLSRDMSTNRVRERLKNLGYDCPAVRVCHGVTKICLIFENTDFIVKWSYGYNCEIDESAKECDIYASAIEANLACFFPKTEVLGKWGEVTVIIQDKIDYCVEDCGYDKRQHYQQIGRTVTDNIYNKMAFGFRTSHWDRHLDETWAKMAISLYGKQVIKCLCDFIQKYKINDLHEKNIGYKNDKPIILDFSGYYR